jgi:OOP family OmpA-OmpF porin
VNNSKTILAGLALTGAVLAFPALAQVGKGALYAGAQLGTSEAKGDFCGANMQCDNKDTAWRAFAGYQFHRHVGIEAGYINFGTLKRGDPATGDKFKTADAIEAVAVVSYQVEKAALFGKVGGYYSRFRGVNQGTGASIDESSGGLTFGAGLQYNALRNLGIRGDWSRYQKAGGGAVGDANVDVFLIGLVLQLP